MEEILRQNAFRFCPACGSQALDFGVKNLKCRDCSYNYYHNIAVGVGALILDGKGRILLSKRAHEPKKGLYDLPGGFVDWGEGLEDGLCREIREELDCELLNVEYLASFPNQYCFKNVLYGVCDAFFTSELPEGAEPKALDDVEAVEWRTLEELEISEIGFPSVAAAIQLCKGRQGLPQEGKNS